MEQIKTMPGFLPHFLVGNIIFFVGWQYLKRYSTIEYAKKDYIYLYAICVICSSIPDFPLGLYYLFDVSTFEVLVPYHILLHLIISPIAVGIFIILNILGISNKKSFILLGVICIIIHIIMDAIIEEMGVWI